MYLFIVLQYITWTSLCVARTLTHCTTYTVLISMLNHMNLQQLQGKSFPIVQLILLK